MQTANASHPAHFESSAPIEDAPLRHGSTRIFYHHHPKGEPCDNWCANYTTAPQWYTASLRSG